MQKYSKILPAFYRCKELLSRQLAGRFVSFGNGKAGAGMAGQIGLFEVLNTIDMTIVK